MQHGASGLARDVIKQIICAVEGIFTRGQLLMHAERATPACKREANRWAESGWGGGRAGAGVGYPPSTMAGGVQQLCVQHAASLVGPLRHTERW